MLLAVGKPPANFATRPTSYERMQGNRH